MPVEGLDEEGLPRNPDVRLAQLRFLLSSKCLKVDKDSAMAELMKAIKEYGLNYIHDYFAVLGLIP